MANVKQVNGTGGAQGTDITTPPPQDFGFGSIVADLVYLAIGKGGDSRLTHKIDIAPFLDSEGRRCAPKSCGFTAKTWRDAFPSITPNEIRPIPGLTMAGITCTGIAVGGKATEFVVVGSLRTDPERDFNVVAIISVAQFEYLRALQSASLTPGHDVNVRLAVPRNVFLVAKDGKSLASVALKFADTPGSKHTVTRVRYLPSRSSFLAFHEHSDGKGPATEYALPLQPGSSISPEQLGRQIITIYSAWDLASANSNRTHHFTPKLALGNLVQASSLQLSQQVLGPTGLRIGKWFRMGFEKGATDFAATAARVDIDGGGWLTVEAVLSAARVPARSSSTRVIWFRSETPFTPSQSATPIIAFPVHLSPANAIVNRGILEARARPGRWIDCEARVPLTEFLSKNGKTSKEWVGHDGKSVESSRVNLASLRETGAFDRVMVEADGRVWLRVTTAIAKSMSRQTRYVSIVAGEKSQSVEFRFSPSQFRLRLAAERAKTTGYFEPQTTHSLTGLLSEGRYLRQITLTGIYGTTKSKLLVGTRSLDRRFKALAVESVRELPDESFACTYRATTEGGDTTKFTVLHGRRANSVVLELSQTRSTQVFKRSALAAIIADSTPSLRRSEDIVISDCLVQERIPISFSSGRTAVFLDFGTPQRERAMTLRFTRYRLLEPNAEYETMACISGSPSSRKCHGRFRSYAEEMPDLPVAHYTTEDWLADCGSERDDLRRARIALNAADVIGQVGINAHTIGFLEHLGTQGESALGAEAAAPNTATVSWRSILDAAVVARRPNEILAALEKHKAGEPGRWEAAYQIKLMRSCSYLLRMIREGKVDVETGPGSQIRETIVGMFPGIDKIPNAWQILDAELPKPFQMALVKSCTEGIRFDIFRYVAGADKFLNPHTSANPRAEYYVDLTSPKNLSNPCRDLLEVWKSAKPLTALAAQLEIVADQLDPKELVWIESLVVVSVRWALDQSGDLTSTVKSLFEDWAETAKGRPASVGDMIEFIGRCERHFATGQGSPELWYVAIDGESQPIKGLKDLLFKIKKVLDRSSRP